MPALRLCVSHILGSRMIKRPVVSSTDPRMTMSRYPLVTVALLCFAPFAGCYRYSPTTLDALLSGANVRAQLSDEGVVRIREITGSESREVEGELIGVDEELVRLSVRLTSENESAFARDLNQRLVLPRDHIVALEVKELDQAKTGATIAAAAAVVTVAVLKAISGSGRSPAQPPPPDGPGEGSIVRPIPFPER